MNVKVNEDKELVEEIIKLIKENDGYCCCALEKTPDTKCMCKEFREQSDPGYCNCMRYYKE